MVKVSVWVSVRLSVTFGPADGVKAVRLSDLETL